MMCLWLLCVVSVQRRLALEMEVKRNERIQSEQQTDLTNQFDANANVKVNNTYNLLQKLS